MEMRERTYLPCFQITPFSSPPLPCGHLPQGGDSDDSQRAYTDAGNPRPLVRMPPLGGRCQTASAEDVDNEGVVRSTHSRRVAPPHSPASAAKASAIAPAAPGPGESSSA